MIHVKDLFRLNGIVRLRLAAGQQGLERRVRSAVLFEYDAARILLSDFYRGDLVLTTLAYAREDPGLVSRSLCALISQGIAGLVVKTGYYSELPGDVLRLADRTDTPVFLFDESYIENALLEITELIRGKRHFTGYERDLDELMRGGLPGDVVREKVRRIDPLWNGPARVYAIVAEERSQPISDALFRLSDEGGEEAVFMSWRWLLLALIHPPGEEKEVFLPMDSLLRRAGIGPETVVVGASGLCMAPEKLGTALSEAAYAVRAARIRGLPRLSADQLGVYAYLLPLSQNAFARDRAELLFAKLTCYDRENGANLAETARAYVHSGRLIPDTARVLYQHPNTVRYRLAKIRALLGMEKDDSFEMTLEWIVRLMDILDAEK